MGTLPVVFLFLFCNEKGYARVFMGFRHFTRFLFHILRVLIFEGTYMYVLLYCVLVITSTMSKCMFNSYEWDNLSTNTEDLTKKLAMFA